MSSSQICILVNHRAKIKENEKLDKYMDLARELKNPWIIKGTVVPIVVSALGKETGGNWRSLEELRPSRLQHYYDQLEYLVLET